MGNLLPVTARFPGVRCAPSSTSYAKPNGGVLKCAAMVTRRPSPHPEYSTGLKIAGRSPLIQALRWFFESDLGRCLPDPAVNRGTPLAGSLHPPLRSGPPPSQAYRLFVGSHDAGVAGGRRQASRPTGSRRVQSPTGQREGRPAAGIARVCAVTARLSAAAKTFGERALTKISAGLQLGEVVLSTGRK